MCGSSQHLGSLMKPYRPFASLFAAIFVVLVAASAVYGQSLGETARKLRQNKPAETSPKIITNDDLSHAAPPADLAETKSEPANTADAAKNPADENGKAEKPKKSDPEIDQAKIDEEWSKTIAAQKQEIAGMERELDLLQRENKLRAASYYADAGTRLRNQQSYAEEDRKYQKDVADKQKALDDAKAKLADLEEQARKAGASAKTRE